MTRVETNPAIRGGLELLADLEMRRRVIEQEQNAKLAIIDSQIAAIKDLVAEDIQDA